jgi:hypothetical protein
MSGYEGACICYMAYVCSARWLFFGYFPGECGGTPSGKNRRIYLLRAWVNKGRTDAWGANEWQHVRADNGLRRESEHRSCHIVPAFMGIPSPWPALRC